MRTFRDLLIFIFLTLVLAIGACSDDSSGGGTDTGGGDTGGNDQGAADQGGSCETINTECFTPLPSSTPNPRVMIERLRVDDDWIIIKNVNSVDQSLDGWWVCQAPTYTAMPTGITLGPAQTLRINLGRSGTDTADEIFLPDADDLGGNDEFAMYSSDNFDSSDAIEVYLRWGSAADGSGRSAEAEAASLWRQGTFAPLCDPNVGIVAVGDGTIVRGFRDQPASCVSMSP